MRVRGGAIDCWRRPAGSGWWQDWGKMRHWRQERRGGVVLDPLGDLRDRGVLHVTCEGDVGESRVPPGGEAETWRKVARVWLEESGLASAGDATEAQIGIEKGLADEVRSI